MTTIQNDVTTTVDAYLSAYGEPDPARRAELIAAAWAEDGELIDPPLTGEGHDGIGAMAEAVQQQFPGHRFRRASGIDAHHDRLRFAWELVAPAGEVVLAGVDVGELAPDGRLRRITGFFGELPALAA
jgi:diadenosine tetraphosphatase ApaH/serine/threonine PP2A family protein phosphatase